MANQKNFVSNISELSVYNTKYTVSRIIDTPTVNPLLEIEIPADFLEFRFDYTVEMHVYSIVDNSLVYTEIIANNLNSDNPIEIQKFMYSNGSRNLLFIDFAKIGEIFPPQGKYRVCFNFFANELNTSAISRGLRITKISPSRKEVEVKYDVMNTDNMQAMSTFIKPSIKAEDALNMMRQVFNQSGSKDIQLNMFTSSIDRERISNTLGPSASAALVQYNFDDDLLAKGTNDTYVSTLGLYQVAQNILDTAFNLVTQSLTNAVSVHKSQSFSLEFLTSSVESAISKSYNIREDDERTNPYKYRFDLI